jgi:hypothetical protein
MTDSYLRVRVLLEISGNRGFHEVS